MDKEKDREAILKAYEKEGITAILKADDSLLADREFMLEAVTIDSGALGYADDSIKANREVVLAAVRQNGRALEHTDPKTGIRADREVVLEAVKEDGTALDRASEELQRDEELRKIAVE